MLDALDGGAMLAALLKRKAKDFPHWLCMMVSTRPEDALHKRLSAFKPTVLTPSLKENMKDLEVHFQVMLHRLGANPEQQHEDLVKELLTRSEGVFFWASMQRQPLQELA